MTRAALGVLALAYALAHLPYLASSLEDIDSVNFALGIRDFDVADHRPHPPGYPVYIAIGKAAVAVVSPMMQGARSAVEARALSFVSLIGALVAIVLLYRVASCWTRDEGDGVSAPWRAYDARAMAATGLAVACPLFWYMSIRPMSDVPGLAAALAAQAALALAWWRQRPTPGERVLSVERLTASGRMIVLGCLLTGFAIGFRSQNAVLTLPLLLGVLADRIGRGVAGALLGGGVAFAIGVVSWMAPMLVASGGLEAYLAALGSQAGEDFAGVDMLYLNPSPRLAASALLRTFIHPWDSVVLGSIIVALAVIGALVMLVRDMRSLVAIALVLLPYLAFHLLFQDTTFVRYALPIVPPTVFLAVYALTNIVRQAAFPVTGALALWGVTNAAPVTEAYGAESSPTVRALAAMTAARSIDPPGALGFHHTFRRPLQAETFEIAPQLGSPPRREWLELTRYWREGRTEPLWFLADPRRSDLALVDPRSRSDRADFTWQFASLSDVGGMRPSAVAWYRMPPPGWFAEEGWALTPETAGIARLMGRGPAIGPITAWVRRRAEPLRLMIGGRHLGASTDPPVTFVVAIDGRSVAQFDATPGFFVHVFDVPTDAMTGSGPLARLTVQSSSLSERRIDTAIEQFDIQTRGSLMWAYDQGWHEAEYSPALGVWRWTSERATLRVIDAQTPVAVAVRIEDPRRYFDDDPVVQMTVGGRVLAETQVRGAALWSVTVPLDLLTAADGRIVIATNRTFVPADESGVADRRALGLRTFGVTIATQP